MVLAQRLDVARNVAQKGAARRLILPSSVDRNFAIYFLSILAVFSIMMILALYLLQPWRWSHLILAIVMYGFTMTFVDRILQYRLRGRDIARLGSLTTRPRVAILYLTYNDAIEECLESLDNQTYPCDIFILDDSTKPEFRRLVNRYKHVKLRRSARKDNKAGAINEWLFHYGSKYDYFVTYDADSMLPPNTIYDLLLFAESPENQDVAVFQASMRIWNAETIMARLLSLKQNVDNVYFGRMLSYLGNTLWFGHNALCRLKPFRETGIRKDLISEDFATSCELIKKRYRLLTVPVITYEGIPNDIKSYLARAMRWFHGGHEAIRLMSRQLPFSVNYRLWTVTYTHLQYTIMPVIMLLFVFNKPSLIEQFTVSMSVFIAFWLIPAVSYVLYAQEMKSSGIGYTQTVKTIFVATAVRTITALYEWKALTLWALGRKPKFAVTPKNKMQKFDNTYMIPLALFVALQVLGIIFYNQEALMYGIFWLPPFLISPIVLYAVNRYVNKQVAEESLRRNFALPPEKTANIRRLDTDEMKRICPTATIVECSGDTILMLGDIELPDGAELAKTIYVRGSVKIGAMSILHGGVNATGNVEIGEQSVIKGGVFAKGNCRVARNCRIADVVEAKGNVVLNEGCQVQLSATSGGRLTLLGDARVYGRLEAKKAVEIISGRSAYSTFTVEAAPQVQRRLANDLLDIASGRTYSVLTMAESNKPPEEIRQLYFYIRDPAVGKSMLITILDKETPTTVDEIASLQALAFLLETSDVKIITSSELEDSAKRLAEFYHMTVSGIPSKQEMTNLLEIPST